MSGLTPRVVWPIEDPDLFTDLSLAVARADLPGIAEELQATLIGTPAFRVARGAVVCEVPAIRRRGAA